MCLLQCALFSANLVCLSFALPPVVFPDARFEIQEHLNITYAQGVTCSGPDARSDSCANHTVVDLQLDMYMPVGAEDWGPRPALVAFHSGAYTHGDRNGTHLALHAACEHFASRGFIAMTVDYRMLTDESVGLAPANWSAASPLFGIEGDKWPGGFNPDPSAAYPAVRDSKAAIRWLKSQADYLNLDPSYVGAMGWSAGAQTVAHLATGFDWDFTTELTFNEDPTLLSAGVGNGISSSIRAGVVWAGNSAVSDIKDAWDGNRRWQTIGAPLAMYRGDRDSIMTDWAQQTMQSRYNATGGRCDLYAVPGAAHTTLWPGGTVGGVPILDHTYAWMADAMSLLRPWGLAEQARTLPIITV